MGKACAGWALFDRLRAKRAHPPLERRAPAGTALLSLSKGRLYPPIPLRPQQNLTLAERRHVAGEAPQRPA
jgi:hypothetical protein